MASVELASAYINIIPTTQGAQGTITELFSGEAQSAGAATGATMGDSMVEGLNLTLLASAAAVAATVGAIAYEAWDTINEVAEYGDTVDKQSQMMSISARSYQELSFAAERSGTSINSFSRGIRNITNDLADAVNGVDGATDTFDALGVSLYNANGEMRTTEEVLYSSIYALADMEDVTQRNALANDIFGRSYTELLPLLNSGSDGIGDLFTRFEELNGAMSDEGVAASAEFEDAMTNLEAAVQGVKNGLAESGLLGTFTNWINTAADWVAQDHPVLEKAFVSLTKAVDRTGQSIGALAYAADGVLEALQYALDPVITEFDRLREQVITDFNSLSPGMGTAGANAANAFVNAWQHPISSLLNSLALITATARGDAAAISQYAGNMGVTVGSGSTGAKGTQASISSKGAVYK